MSNCGSTCSNTVDCRTLPSDEESAPQRSASADLEGLEDPIQLKMPAPRNRPQTILLVLAGMVAGAGCATAGARAGAPAVWSITVLGDSSDRRFIAIQEAARYWNLQLEAIGSHRRFGTVSPSAQRLPEPVLRELSATVIGRGRIRQPAGFNRIEGDVVVALSSSPDITSIGIDPERFGGRGLVVLRPGHVAPLSCQT